MNFHANIVSSDWAGDIYQIFFAAEDETEEPESPYLLIQRQFEIPNDACYIEMNDMDYTGHFRIRSVDFTPKKLVIKLPRRRNDVIEVAIGTTDYDFEKAAQILRIITGEREPFDE